MVSKRRSEAVAQSYSVKSMFLEISQNSQENTCARQSCRPKACKFNEMSNNTFWYITALVAASCKIYEIFKNSYFEEHLWTTASKLI